MVNHIYVLTGSNMGDRLAYLNFAQSQFVSKGYKVLQASRIYETGAWGIENQQAFYNQCLRLQHEQVTPHNLLQDIRDIEIKAGRSRDMKWGPRTLDVDILLFEDLVLNSPELSIPHPFLPRRRFALVPLSEVNADFIHPVHLQSIAQLLQQCPDTGMVTPSS